MSFPHPEFEASLEGRIADAVLVKLAANAELAAYLTGGIDAMEMEALYREGAVNIAPPALVVILDAVDVRPSGSNRESKMEVLVELALATEAGSARNKDGWLRSRVIRRIRKVLADKAGALYTGPGETGTQLTHAILLFQRVPQPIRLRPESSTFLTILRVLYTTTMKALTEEPTP